MALVKTKHFGSTRQAPTSPPDGSSLEEMMNGFLATLSISALLDIHTSVTSTSTASLRYVGVVIYQE